jgi:hypothetical protein
MKGNRVADEVMGLSENIIVLSKAGQSARSLSLKQKAASETPAEAGTIQPEEYGQAANEMAKALANARKSRMFVEVHEDAAERLILLLRSAEADLARLRAEQDQT